MWREYDSRGRGIAYELLESDPPRKLVTRIADRNLPYSGTWTFDLQPAAQGTELAITEDGEVSNPLFRFVSRFIMGHTATIDAYLRALAAKLG